MLSIFLLVNDWNALNFYIYPSGKCLNMLQIKKTKLVSDLQTGMYFIQSYSYIILKNALMIVIAISVKIIWKGWDFYFCKKGGGFWYDVMFYHSLIIFTGRTLRFWPNSANCIINKLICNDTPTNSLIAISLLNDLDNLHLYRIILYRRS